MSILFPTRRLVTDRRYYEAGVRGRFEGNLRVERGIVDTAPSVVSGFGFTLTRNGTGDVTITFDPPFASMPSVTASAIVADTNATYPVHQYSITSATVRLLRYQTTLTGNAIITDGQISFIAIGPS